MEQKSLDQLLKELYKPKYRVCKTPRHQFWKISDSMDEWQITVNAEKKGVVELLTFIGKRIVWIENINVKSIASPIFLMDLQKAFDTSIKVKDNIFEGGF